MRVAFDERSIETTPRRHYLVVSKRVFVAIWLGLLVLHGVCALYYGAVAAFYRAVPGTYLASTLTYFGLGMRVVHYPKLAAIHACICGVHALLALLMVTWSLYKRRWSFGPLQEIAFRDAAARLLSARRIHVAHSPSTTRRRVFVLFDSLFGRRGLFGVEGEHFDALLIAREIIETTLQTQQAFRMSQLVPRAWLNRSYVVLVVLNCWLTPAVQMLCASKPLLRRTLVLLCDAVLDLVTSVAIPGALVLAYMRDYDPVSGGFDSTKWLNDMWFVNVSNEFQLILVTSWGDLAARVVFCLGLLSCFEAMKRLVRPRRAVHTAPPATKRSVAQIAVTSVVVAPAPASKRRKSSNNPALAIARAPSRWGSCVERAFHACFAAVGVAVLVLHIHAEAHATLPQCALQTHPWLSAKPTCALFMLDCHRDAIAGDAAEVDAQWTPADALGVKRVLVRHCPALCLPARLQQFQNLRNMKIYNSSVACWNQDAALTETHHPSIVGLSLVRVQFPDGELPRGLTSADFPPQLLSIQICGSNLRTLPADLDTKWPKGGIFLFENSDFDALPPVIMRLQPTQLSFAGNTRFARFPLDVLQVPRLKFFNLGATSVDSLLAPAVHAPLPDRGSIQYLSLIDSNVSVLPRWLDVRINASLPVFLARTPFCADAARVASGALASFPGVDGVAESEMSFVMRLTHAANAAELTTLVRSMCAPRRPTFYPLQWEDGWSGLPHASSS